MSPTTSASISSEISVWKSPVPYLFGGLALIVTLISVALIILMCTHRNSYSDQAQSADEDIEEAKQAVPENNYIMDESEPKIVVIMAGDDMPSYLAKPTSSSSICCHCGAEVQTSSLSSTSLEQRL